MNEAMPLVRYTVGDRGSLGAAEGPACPCRRTLPLLAGVEGRVDDVIVTPDGRRIGRLDPVFKGDMPIREAQIVQDTLDRLVVRIVPAAGYTARTGDEVRARLRDRVGDMRIEIETLEAIPRTANGKFRAVVSNVAVRGSAATRTTPQTDRAISS
jgi:phenylacetate-CoA ligase